MSKKHTSESSHWPLRSGSSKCEGETTAEREREREEASAIVNVCIATEKVFNTTERWLFPLNVGHINRERKRERKWACCLSLDTGCVGACKLKYQPLPFSTVKEWQPHDSLHTAHANTQLMHLYRWQNLHSPALLHKFSKFTAHAYTAPNPTELVKLRRTHW